MVLSVLRSWDSAQKMQSKSCLYSSAFVPSGSDYTTLTVHQQTRANGDVVNCSVSYGNNKCYMRGSVIS